MRDMGKQQISEFARRLKELRQSAGLTQQELATRAGVSISSLTQIEQGKTTDPRLSTVTDLAWALGIKPSKLIDGVWA
jgi:transcriptional regulator with XRE-family HTH domain